MKALKEKRISLRSLWRRGLVILSLFALVFASCGDSSSSDDSSSGPRVTKIVIKTGPTNDQYYGRRLDLTGVTLRAYYSDGTDGIVTDTSKFTTIPRVVTGVYYDNVSGIYEFDPLTEYEIVYGGAHDTLDLSDYDDIGIFKIIRENTVAQSTVVTKDPALYDLGLHLTGAASIADKTVYADDDVFDFKGLSLEADYLNTKLNKIERKEISFADVTWSIVPDYNAKANEDGSYPGYIYLTAGELIDATKEEIDNLASLGIVFKGITVAAPLKAVWTVLKDGIEISGYELPDYYYWMENSRPAWIDRLGDAVLTVNYTGNAAPKTFPIKDLWTNTKIWYNANPSQGWYLEHDPEYIDYDFDVQPIPYPFDKKHTNPAITVYYRGALTKIPVDVYTTLVSVSVAPKASGELFFDPRGFRDNDVENGDGGPAGLAAMLDVKALYSAYNDSSKQKELPLEYWWGLTPRPAYNTGAYYEFDTGDASYRKLYNKWVAKGMANLTQSITVRHTIDRGLVKADWIAKEWCASGFTGLDNIKSPQSKKAAQSVTWGIK